MSAGLKLKLSEVQVCISECLGHIISQGCIKPAEENFSKLLKYHERTGEEKELHRIGELVHKTHPGFCIVGFT